MRRVSITLAAAIAAAAIASACSAEPDATKKDKALTLPVSINATMVALVDYAAEPIWLDAYEPPTTERGWRDAEHFAYQIAIGGKTIQLAGTGPYDADWVKQPKWIEFSNDMSEAGMDALAAAQAKDVAALNLAGDKLVESCEACHIAFKPDLPSMGMYKPLDYPN